MYFIERLPSFRVFTIEDFTVCMYIDLRDYSSLFTSSRFIDQIHSLLFEQLSSKLQSKHQFHVVCINLEYLPTLYISALCIIILYDIVLFLKFYNCCTYSEDLCIKAFMSSCSNSFFTLIDTLYSAINLYSIMFLTCNCSCKQTFPQYILF